MEHVRNGGPLRLNLACGTDIRDGWANLDVVERWPLARRACDWTWDARSQPIPFPDGTVDEVYAGYLLLHLANVHHERVVRDMHRVLKPGGRLVVGEVDYAILLPRWLENPGDPYLSGLVFGEQGQLPGGAPAEQQALAEFDAHRQGFTEASLRALLAGCGFVNETRRIKVHGEAVWYEMTLETYR